MKKSFLLSFFSFCLTLTLLMGITSMQAKKEVKAEIVAQASNYFEMEDGAAFRTYWSTPNCGITFTAHVAEELANKYHVKLIIVPYDYLTAIDEQVGTSAKERLDAGDYIGALTDAGKSYVTVDNVYHLNNGDGTYILSGGIKNIKAGNVNRKYFGVYFYENEYGTRVYAKINSNNYANNARSMAYVSNSAYFELSGISPSYANDMITYQMDRAIYNAIERYEEATDSKVLNNIVMDSITYKSIANEEKFLAGEPGYRRNNMVVVNASDGGLKNFSVGYYDDLLTYDLRLYIGKYNSNNEPYQTSIIVTDYLDFKLDLTINATDYVEKDGAYVKVKKESATVIANAISVRVGQDGLVNRSLTINSYNIDEAKDNIVISDQYYTTDTYVFSPLAEVNIMPDNNKIVRQKTFMVKPSAYANNTKVSTLGTATISGFAGIGSSSTLVNFNIKSNEEREYTITIKHQDRNGLTIAENDYINIKANGSVSDRIYNRETLTTAGVTLESKINSVISNLKTAKTPYLPDKFWVAGLAEKDEEIVITWTKSSVWDGLYPTNVKDSTGVATNNLSVIDSADVNQLVTVKNTAFTTLFYGSGTKEDPFLINNAYDLVKLSATMIWGNKGNGQYFKLTTSIDLNGSSKWIPLGANSGGFRGVLDGNGYSIAGINVDGFALADKFTELNDPNVNSALKSIDQWGGLFCYLQNVKGDSFDCGVLDIVVQGNVTANQVVGGIAGNVSYNTFINNVTNFVDVSSPYEELSASALWIGGLAGRLMYGAKIENSYNYGSVISNKINGGRVGGLVGDTNASITSETHNIQASISNSINYGKVVGYYRIGGIIGRGGLIKVANCQNYGSVLYNDNNSYTGSNTDLITRDSVGGIVGIAFYSASIESCTNYANIYGYNYVGGIVGILHTSSTSNCKNYGSLLTAHKGTVGSPAQKGNIYAKLNDDKNASTSVSSKGKIRLTINYLYEDGSSVCNPSMLYVAPNSGGYAIFDKTTTYDYVPSASFSITYTTISPTISGYLPNLFWVEGAFNKDTIVNVIYSESDVWDGTRASGFVRGNGSISKPYLIETAEQFAYFASLGNALANTQNKYFKLVTNIDLNGLAWSPMASFAGYLDGNNKTIAGLYINNSAEEQGLFAKIIGGTVINLTVQGGSESLTSRTENSSVTYQATLKGGITASRKIGGLAYSIQSSACVSGINTFVDINSTYATPATTTLKDSASTVTNAYFEGYNGGICGQLATSSSVLNCNNYGRVSSYGRRVGGIVGYANIGVIDSCQNHSNLIGGARIGGIVGDARGGVTIRNCINTGEISQITFPTSLTSLSFKYLSGSTVKEYAGGIYNGNITADFSGISGYSDNVNLTFCKNFGNIAGNHRVAWIVSYLANNCAIENYENYGVTSLNGKFSTGTYSDASSNKKPYAQMATTAAVSSVKRPVLTVNYLYEDGSLAGPSVKVTLTANENGFVYFNKNCTDYSGNNVSTVSPTISGYLPDLYWVAGYWDINKNIDHVINVTYKKADVWDGSVATSYAGGRGTKDDPYLISTGAELAYMSSQFYRNLAASSFYAGNQYYKLTNSIDLNGIAWTPIGYRDLSVDGWGWAFFDGTFDGCGYTIGGLTNNASTIKRGVALFVAVSGTVKNLTLQGAFTGEDRVSSVCYYAGHTGGNNGANLENINSFINITATKTDGWCGGISGTSRTTIYSNCHYYGDLVATSSVKLGGITGDIYGGVFENCVSYGNITGKDQVGGIVGNIEYEKVYTTLTNCVNYGTVKCSQTLVQFYQTVVFPAVDASGNYVLDTSGNKTATGGLSCRIGGIVGYQYRSVVSNSINHGKVVGLRDVGGISGTTLNAEVIGCVNYGDVLILDSDITTKEALKTALMASGWNASWSTSDTNIVKKILGRFMNHAGIVGNETFSTYIQNCVNNGSVTGWNNVAGIAGYVGLGSSCNDPANRGSVQDTNLNNVILATENTTGELKQILGNENVYNYGGYSSRDGVITQSDYNSSTGLLYYVYFGAAGDGVTDDFIAMFKTHLEANHRSKTITNVVVKAEVGKTYYVKNTVVTQDLYDYVTTNYAIPNGSTDAKGYMNDVYGLSFTVGKATTIPIATNVDWNGASFIIDDEQIAPYTRTDSSGNFTASNTNVTIKDASDKQYNTNIFKITSIRNTEYTFQQLGTYSYGGSSVPYASLTSEHFNAMTQSEFDSLIKGKSWLTAINKQIQEVGVGPHTTKLNFALGYPAVLIIKNEKLTDATKTRLVAGKNIKGDQRVYNRYGDVEGYGIAKQDIIIVDEQGNVDMSSRFMFDYTRVVQIYAYRLDISELVISGGSFTTKASILDTKFNYNSSTKTVTPMGITGNSNFKNYTSYISRGMGISRNNVTIKNLEHYIVNEVTMAQFVGGICPAPYNGFYNVSNCANVTLENCIMTARRYYSSGSYDFNATSATNVKLINCMQSNFWIVDNDTSVNNVYKGVAEGTAGAINNMSRISASALSALNPSANTEINITYLQHYWGIGGTNLSKNVEYYGCYLSRFDAHKGILNGKIIDSKICGVSITGQGDFYMDNVTIYAPADGYQQNSLVNLRSDYGSTWNGTLYFNNVTLNAKNAGSDSASFVYYSFDNANYGYKCYLPNIEAENVKINNASNIYVFRGNGNDASLMGSMHDNSVVSNVFTMPQYVLINNCVAIDEFTMYAGVDNAVSAVPFASVSIQKMVS